MSGNMHVNRATCVVLRQAWVDHLIGYNQINRRSTKWWRKLFFFMMSCHNSYVAARCVGDTTGRANYRGYKERLWAPVRGAPYTNDVEEPPRPPFPSPSPGPSVTEPTAVNTQHGFNKAYNLRNQCSECQLLPKGRKRQKWEWLHNLWLCTV